MLFSLLYFVRELFASAGRYSTLLLFIIATKAWKQGGKYLVFTWLTGL
jgi:hypothetical protein